MATFKINGKEHELKLTYKAVKRLNAQFEGGPLEVLGKAVAGDFNAFPHIVHAGLLHTGEEYTLDAVEEAIERAVENEELDLREIMRISNDVVTDSFFYKATAEKFLAKDKKAKQMLDDLRK